MQDGILNHLLAVVICTYALTSGLSAQVWDPAEHLSAHWEAVTATTRLYNPPAGSERDRSTRRWIFVDGGIDVIDANGLVGVDMRERSFMVLDQEGAEVYSATREVAGVYSYRAPDTMDMGIGFGIPPFWFSLATPVDPNQGCPSSLSRIEWSVGVLVADNFQVVDVPFEPNDNWVELVPGLEIQVEQASVEEGRCEYRIQAMYSEEVVSYLTSHSWYFRADKALPDVVVARMDLLNAAGQSVRDLGSGTFRNNTTTRTEDGLTVATGTGYGRCDTCGEVTTIRYALALAPYERQARFVLEDIPVPGF